MSAERPNTMATGVGQHAQGQNARGTQGRRQASDPDQIQAAPSIPHPSENPFATPAANTPYNSTPFHSNPVSRATSRERARGMNSGANSSAGVEKKFFKSRRIKKETFQKPWKEKKDPREKWVTIIPIMGIIVGLAISGVLIWDGLRSVTNFKYCEVLSDDFSGGLNDKIWTKEVEVGGFG